MWIFLNDAYLSVVAHRHRPADLLVRSRIRGDIERAIPWAKTFEDPHADYRYRAIVSRLEFNAALMKAVDRIDYPNFKDSVPKDDPERHAVYMSVWQLLARWYGAYGRDPVPPLLRPKNQADLEGMGLPEDEDIRAFLEE